MSSRNTARSTKAREWDAGVLAALKRRRAKHFRERAAEMADYCAKRELVREAMARAPLRVRRLLVWPKEPAFVPLPPELVNLPCGATTRAGSQCRRTDLFENGRCRLHGGLSVGPRTGEGREKALANLRLRWSPPTVEESVREALQSLGISVGTP